LAGEAPVGSRYGRLLIALAPLLGLLLVVGVFALMSDAPDQYLSGPQPAHRPGADGHRRARRHRHDDDHRLRRHRPARSDRRSR
jgi:hypothetical protein